MARVHEFRFRAQRWVVSVDGDTVRYGPVGEPPAEIAIEVGDGAIRTPQGKHRYAAARTAAGVWVCVDGFTAFLEFADAEHDAGAAASADEVRAPMTGTVVRVDAVPGAAVAAGDVLVILTAMKMEYRLEAPRDGTVARVTCTADEHVELGRVLVALEPA